jgi:hypothetical protein
MEQTFVGRDQIIGALPTLAAANETEGRRPRIEFVINGDIYVSTYRVVDEGQTLALYLNGSVQPLVDRIGTRVLVGDQYNNLTPATLTSITLITQD